MPAYPLAPLGARWANDQDSRVDTYLWGGTGSCAFHLREMILQALLYNLLKPEIMLGPEARSRLDNTFLQSTNIILQAAQRNKALAQLPIGILDVVPKRV